MFGMTPSCCSSWRFSSVYFMVVEFSIADVITRVPVVIGLAYRASVHPDISGCVFQIRYYLRILNNYHEPQILRCVTQLYSECVCVCLWVCENALFLSIKHCLPSTSQLYTFSHKPIISINSMLSSLVMQLLCVCVHVCMHVPDHIPRDTEGWSIDPTILLA